MPSSDLDTPILYTFRRCPYAMRARMALKYSGARISIREVVLRHKPAALLECSAKGTVPVLVLADGKVIDESRDIMLWALSLNDPEQWRYGENNALNLAIEQLLDMNDFEFKGHLDRYKYPNRYPGQSAEFYRIQGEKFLLTLERKLITHHFLMGDKVSMADIAIFPFIRQFANVDIDWFNQAPYTRLQAWLGHFIHSGLFISVMHKYLPWEEHSQPVFL